MKRNGHNEAILFLLVQVFKVVLPFLLDNVRIDETMRIGRVFDKHQWREIIELSSVASGRSRSHPSLREFPPYPLSDP